MVNYQNGKIYKLVNDVDDEIYVGSTCRTLSKRKGDHRSSSNICPERHVYKHLNGVGWDNVKIVLIENYQCNNKEELFQRERYWIDQLKPTLNKIRPVIDDNEKREQIRKDTAKYRIKHRDKIHERKQKYYETKKDVILESQREYRNANKERINERRKELRELNKDIYNGKKQAYYHQNKDRLNEARKQTVICECGVEHRKCDSARHNRSKKHQEFVKE